jgi:hypothetical protein
MMLPPARWLICIIRPSTCAGTPDATGRDDHRLRGECEIADRRTRTGLAPGHGVGLQDRPGDAGDRAVGQGQAVDLVAEPELQQPAGGGVADPALEHLDHPGTGAPGDVEPRNGVAVPGGGVPAALGPADDREQPVAHLTQPGPLLAGSEIDVGLGPPARPLVLVPVETSRPEPVLPGQLDGVLDPQSALFRAVDQEQAAEGPERLAAETLLALLLQEQDLAAGVGEFGGGGESGEAGSDHDDVCVHGNE